MDGCGNPEPAGNDAADIEAEAVPEINKAPRRRLRPRHHAIRIGSTLAESLSIWARHFLPYTALALLLGLPLYATLFFLSSQGGGQVQAFHQTLVTGIGASFVSLFLGGVISFSVFQHSRGKPSGLGDCVRVGLRRLWPIFGAGLLAGLCIGLGLLALYLPGLVILCMLFVTVPVAAVENPGIRKSLTRSRILTRDNRWTIFLIALLLGLLSGGLGMVVDQWMLEDVPGRHEDPESYSAAYTYVLLTVTLVHSGLYAVIQAVTYHGLRTGKEGVALEDLASVFE